MTDLAKIAGLIAGGRISEATDLFRQAQPGADITVMFGALLEAGFQDEGVACLKWEARRTEGSENLDLLKFLTAMLYNMKDYEEAEPFAETLCRMEPEFGLWYTIRAWARMAADDPAGVRKVIADAQEKITVHGIDFQPSMPPDVSEFEAEAEEALAARRRKYLAEAESGKKPSNKAAKGKERKKKAPNKESPQVDTGNACEFGTTGAILSGRIAGISAPGTAACDADPAPIFEKTQVDLHGTFLKTRFKTDQLDSRVRAGPVLVGVVRQGLQDGPRR